MEGNLNKKKQSLTTTLMQSQSELDSELEKI